MGGVNETPVTRNTGMRARRWRRRLGFICLLALFCTAAVSLLLAYGPGPRYLAEVLTHWADQEGFQVELQSVRITGWGRVALGQLSMKATESSRVELRVERALVTFDPFRLLSGDSPQDALSQVVLLAPRLLVGDVEKLRTVQASETAATAQHLLQSTRTTLPRTVQPGAVQVSIQHGEILWETGSAVTRIGVSGEGLWHGSTLQIGDLSVGFEDESASGRFVAQGEMHYDLNERVMSGTVQGGPADVTLGAYSYRLDSFAARFHAAGATLYVDSFTGERGDGALQASGTVHADRSFDLAVDASGLLFERDLPFLAPYDFSGPASFSGRISGSPAAWELEGLAEVGPGTIWGRDNVSGEGHILLSPGGMTFSGVRLTQYGGEYLLDGIWEFRASGDPGRLDLAVQVRSGQVKEVLDLLRWEAPAAGRLYGRLRFYGPLDSLMAEGDVELVEAVLWDQPLDRIKGTFALGSSALHVAAVEADLGSGKAYASGRLDLADLGLDVAFEVADWPLGFTALFEDRFGHAIGGMIDVRRGSLSGTLAAPQVMGEVQAEALRVGPTLFRSVSGRLGFSEGRLQLDGLRGLRAGGGSYLLSGTIDFIPAEPAADMTLQVEEERLRSLLQLAGEQLPAALIDGEISGTIHVEGTLVDPTAELHLLLKETLALKRALRVVMTYTGGALRVSELELPSLDAV